jgi:PTS system glucose-specific IIC component
VFLFYIKKFNVPTPGRVKNSKLFTKSDYKKAKSSKISTLKNEEIKSIVRALGGKTNIVKTSNCATRLRYDLKDTSKINEDQLKKYGIVAVMKISKKHAQIIVGPKASTLNSKIEKYLK